MPASPRLAALPPCCTTARHPCTPATCGVAVAGVGEVTIRKGEVTITTCTRGRLLTLQLLQPAVIIHPGAYMTQAGGLTVNNFADFVVWGGLRKKANVCTKVWKNSSKTKGCIAFFIPTIQPDIRLRRGPFARLIIWQGKKVILLENTNAQWFCVERKKYFVKGEKRRLSGMRLQISRISFKPGILSSCCLGNRAYSDIPHWKCVFFCIFRETQKIVFGDIASEILQILKEIFSKNIIWRTGSCNPMLLS